MSSFVRKKSCCLYFKRFSHSNRVRHRNCNTFNLSNVLSHSIALWGTHTLAVMWASTENLEAYKYASVPNKMQVVEVLFALIGNFLACGTH